MTPAISIIICTYNRELYLPKCLEHLRLQDCNKEDFEIVIVNNNSPDNTESICLEFIEKNTELNVTYVVESQAGLSFARNKGIEVSKGKVLCFIDDDGFAIPEYVSIVKKYSEASEYLDIISFGGKVIPCYNEGKEPNWLSKYIDGLVSKVDLGDKVKPFDNKYPAGCNMVFRREFFEQHGGFNTDLHTRGDDKFVFDKLKRSGHRTLYIPSLVVRHFIDDYRLEKKFIVRLSKIIGQSEFIRLKNGSFTPKLLKLCEYVFKYFASLVIAVAFVFFGQFSKAKYIILVRWNVIQGYLRPNKI